VGSGGLAGNGRGGPLCCRQQAVTSGNMWVVTTRNQRHGHSEESTLCGQIPPQKRPLLKALRRSQRGGPPLFICHAYLKAHGPQRPFPQACGSQEAHVHTFNAPKGATSEGLCSQMGGLCSQTQGLCSPKEGYSER